MLYRQTTSDAGSRSSNGFVKQLCSQILKLHSVAASRKLEFVGGDPALGGFIGEYAFTSTDRHWPLTASQTSECRGKRGEDPGFSLHNQFVGPL